MGSHGTDKLKKGASEGLAVGGLLIVLLVVPPGVSEIDLEFRV